MRIKNEFRDMNRFFSPGFTLALGLFGLVRTVASLKCHSCIEKVNHVGEPIGISQDAGCLLGENLEEHEIDCADGEVCMVDILTDWLAEGKELHGHYLYMILSVRIITSFQWSVKPL